MAESSSVAKYLHFKVMMLRCGQLPVVVGAAPASQLCAISFPDVLDETREQGYQRPIDVQHSRGFRDYIEKPGSTTIPLTLNLRGKEGDGWKLGPFRDGVVAMLAIRIPSREYPPVLAQVDCQHRLGKMADSQISLTFQCFLALTAEEEMSIFSVINGKAKGLSSSLLDYHATKLVPDLETVRLDLYIAKALHNDSESVWHGKVKLGGAATQGSQRRISLRGLQAATKLLLHRCPLGAAADFSPVEKYQAVRNFWFAVASVWPTAWKDPRKHLLAKGVGVTALSLLAADIIKIALSQRQLLGSDTFIEFLQPLADLDWSASGPFNGFGGRHGANEAHQFLTSRLFAPGLAVARAGAE